MGFENLRNAIDKKHGQGAMVKVTDDVSFDVELLETGSLAIDNALGGGIPKGRIVELYGPESAGKSLLASTIIASAQKQGIECMLIDAEHALHLGFMEETIGVDVDSLWIAQPMSAEEALDIMNTACAEVTNSLIVLDSVAAMAPKAELEGDVGDAHIGLVARLMGRALRKMGAEAQKNGNTLIFINQLRSNIGGFGYGPTETTPGGKALKFYASQRLEIRRVGNIKQGEEIIGHKANLKVQKNKIAAPNKVAKIEIYYDRGISNEAGIAEAAIEAKLITKSGAWFKDSETGDTIAQGKVGLVDYLEENPDYTSNLEKLIKQQ